MTKICKKQDNSDGQLGYENAEFSPQKSCTPKLVMKEKLISASMGGNHTLILTEAGNLLYCGLEKIKHPQYSKFVYISNHTPKKIMSANIRQIYAGLDHSVVLLKDGSLVFFGSSNFGQCGGVKELVEASLLEFEEPVVRIMGSWDSHCQWTFDTHSDFDEYFRKRIFFFLLCMKSKIPRMFKLPKPILSIVINLSL